LALLHTFRDCALFVRFSAHRAQLLSSGSDSIVVLNHHLGAPLGRVHVHSHRPSTNEQPFIGFRWGKAVVKAGLENVNKAPGNGWPEQSAVLSPDVHL
jgi:hypothetical protein